MKSITLSSPPAVVRVHDLPGGGIPLVFVHGLGCASSCDYPRVAHDPALSWRHAVLVDLLGSGFSDRPPEFDYSVEAHARVVVAVINALALPVLDLYGHSMGGAIAIEVATMLSTRVCHLILSEPNLDAVGGSFSRMVAAQTEVEFSERGYAETIRETTTSGHHTLAGSIALTAPFAAHRAAVSLVRGGSPSWRDQLLSLAAHRTVLFGAHSLPDPDAESLPQGGITVAVIAQASHFMAWENPSGLAAAIATACSQPVTIPGPTSAA